MRIKSLISKAVTAILLGVTASSFYACLLPVGSGLGLSDSGDKPTSVFADKVQPIFTKNCVGCHHSGGSGWSATGGSAGGLDLSTGNSYASLLGSGTGQTSFEVPGTLRVNPANADSSYIYQKIFSASPKSGVQMPQGGPYLSTDDINTIKNWIADGAKP